jgi:AraC family transcriptional regulator of adaptative response / DNA-3-methyladenine glycosylase II
MKAESKHGDAGPEALAGPEAPGGAGPQDPLDALEGLLLRVRLEPGRFPDPDAMARELALDPEALDRLLRVHAHLDAEAFLRQARVAAARRMLPDTIGPAWAVGAACGFRSPAGFRAQLLAATGLTPAGCQELSRSDARSCTLALPPGYRVEDALAYHGRDPLSRSERVTGTTLVKAMLVADRPVLLELAFQDGAVRLRMLTPDGPAWPDAVAPAGQKQGAGSALVQAPDPAPLAVLQARAVRMLGLGVDPAPFERFVRPLPLRRLVAPRRGLRIPLTADVWESLVWAVLGQQVNLAFAYSLRRRLTELCGVPVAPGPGPGPGQGLLAHPGPAAVAALDPAELLPLQFSRGKAGYLVALARKVADGTLPLEALPLGTATGAALRLEAERGVGPWTAHYVLMRGCGFGDCVPLGDAGLTLALQRQFGLDHRPTVRETVALMAPFAPHRSLATFHLWASLKGVPA